jgi:probable rRNA maturation factor
VEDGISAEWDEARIRPLVASIVARELPAGEYVLGLHLVGNKTIRRLNADHRQMDAVTDALSFPLFESGFVLPAGEPVSLGDVVICHPRAAMQAEEYGHSVEREIAYLVAHGVLHVLGYDHEVEDQRERMRMKEEEALQPLGFTR